MHAPYRTIRSIALLASFLTSLQAYDAYSRTYLATHTPFDTLSPECISLFHNRKAVRKNGREGAGQITFFGGKTTRPHVIAQYFLPNGKDTIIVGEDASNAAVSRTRDVNAAYFDIVTANVWTDAELQADFTHLTFESQVQFCPKQKLYGIGIAWQQQLTDSFWFDITIPIVQIKNNLGMCEKIFNKGGSCQECTYEDITWKNSFISGACQSSNGRCYGNMTNKWLKKTRVSHIDIRGGLDTECMNDCAALSGYVGVMIPTGNKPCNLWLFEPIVGDSHLGLEFGTWLSFKLMDDKTHSLTTYLSGMTRYLLPNNQYRSFDLRGKPWSRYMWVWTDNNNGQAATLVDALQDKRDYLINYSTLCVNVKPHYSYEVNSALDYKYKGFHAEVGFNFYGKKAEEICFTHAMNNAIGLEAVRRFIDTPHIPATRSESTISSPLFKLSSIMGTADDIVNTTGANDTSTYVPLTTDYLDPLSGAQPEIMSQTLYGTLAYAWDNIKFPVLLSGGASYEFSHGNAAVSRWIGWLKFGISI